LLKIALIADTLTSCSLEHETSVKTKNITPSNYKFVLRYFKPDFLFVESAWQGYKNKWKFQIASYKDYPKRNNKKLHKVVSYAKKLGIPTVFWNKEDGVHFDRFIDSAKLFDHIFTVDENCIPKYKTILSKTVTVNTLMFAVQSKFHHYHDNDEHFTIHAANFVGSYSHHIHDKRRKWQNMAFHALEDAGLPLDVYDRNSDRKSLTYRYPNLINITVNPAVPYKETAKLYKEYIISLNVNTITDSETMYSRRLVEILASGGLAITNNTKAVKKYFQNYCYIVDTYEEMTSVISKLQNGLTKEDRIMTKKASEYILNNHTWKHRINEIRSVVGI